MLIGELDSKKSSEKYLFAPYWDLNPDGWDSDLCS